MSNLKQCLKVSNWCIVYYAGVPAGWRGERDCQVLPSLSPNMTPPYQTQACEGEQEGAGQGQGEGPTGPRGGPLGALHDCRSWAIINM